MALPEPASTAIDAARLDPLYERIQAILTEAHGNVTRTVNAETVRAYGQAGREAVQEAQAGSIHAAYGETLLKRSSARAPEDPITDSAALEFLGLPESHRLVEAEMEEALISNLQHFLLELGSGFAFVARQRRLTLDGDHFYVDLVFYHTRLKCYVLVDLKAGKLTHADLGQMQLYVNYYDAELCAEDDNATLGLILCADKNEAVVKYTLGDAGRQVFASRYQLHLPSEQALAEEMRRELRQLSHPIGASE